MDGQVLAEQQMRNAHIINTGPSLAQAVVAHLYDVSMDDLFAATRRGAKAAFARQVVMYLMHVVYGLSLTEVAAQFRRDRTTVSHACHRVEDLRDDAVLDRQLSQLENLLRQAVHIEVGS
jgi:chromosomal replication initiation ATPase DnaA